MKKIISSVFIIAGISFSGFAQPYLIKDIWPGISSGASTIFTGIGFQNHMYFPAYDSLSDFEPWITDGTTNGTYRLYDINPGTTSSNPNTFFEFNGNVVFVASDAANGTELWKTDGTTSGTSRIADINPGAGDGVSDYLKIVWIHNGFFYFHANDGISGVELWRSDGTPSGTSLLYDIYPGNIGSQADSFYVFNNEMYFQANTPTEGTELWKTDGTPGGTLLVKNIQPGATSGFYQNGFKVVWEHNGYFFFVGNTSPGKNLWMSNGTDTGTHYVQVPSTTSGENPAGFYDAGNVLYYSSEDPTHGTELWKTDGTSSGTMMVKDIYPGSNDAFNPLIVVWGHNGKIYFNATDSNGNTELWLSDGTDAGTMILADIFPGISSSSPNYFHTDGTHLYFMANDNVHGLEPWASDGTPPGTIQLAEIDTTASAMPIQPVWDHNGLHYFISGSSTTHDELWVTNGTPSGTSLVMDFCGMIPGSTLSDFRTFNNELFFKADDCIAGLELWKTDGTTGGTVLVKDFVNGSGSGLHFLEGFLDLFECAGEMYMTAWNNNVNQIDQLWKTDGTTAGTQLVSTPGLAVADEPEEWVFLDNYAIFPAYLSATGMEYWALPIPCNTTSVDGPAHDMEAMLYPNPANANLTIETSGEKITSAVVYDLMGSVVKNRIQFQSDSRKIKIDVSGMAPGCYVVKCNSEKYSVTKKFTVIRD